MNRFLPVSLLICLLAFYSSPAQNLSEDDLLVSPDLLLEQDLSGTGNSTYVQQVGSENTVDILQQRNSDARINLVRVLQSGDYNRLYLVQNGSGNQTAVIQRGNDNFYDSEVVGRNNEMVIIQDGDRNRIIQDLISSNELNIEFVQQGSDNEIIQLLDNTNNQEFKIIQRGDGLRAIINQGSDY